MKNRPSGTQTHEATHQALRPRQQRFALPYRTLGAAFLAYSRLPHSTDRPAPPTRRHDQSTTRPRAGRRSPTKPTLCMASTDADQPTNASHLGPGSLSATPRPAAHRRPTPRPSSLTQLSLCASTARAATPPSRQPWASPSSAPPSRRRELLWTAPRRVRVTRANSASSFRSLQDSGIIMNSLLQYCADSRVPRTDHIMYSATHCSIMHLQVPNALIVVLTGVCATPRVRDWRGMLTCRSHPLAVARGLVACMEGPPPRDKSFSP